MGDGGSHATRFAGWRCIAIFGPTASGKTDLACALADRVPARLISCDAVQVYRSLDAATAKPEGEQRRHRWALIDMADPGDDVDLGRWVRAAEQEVDSAHREGAEALIVGGTGLYLRGLVKGVAKAPPRDPQLRARLLALAARRGSPWLHRVLGRFDPQTASRLGPGDLQRIVRALEVYLIAGRPLSGLHGFRWRGPDRFPVLRIGLELPREELYRRIDARVDTFFRRGLVDEVRRLLVSPTVAGDANALKALGYREVAAWLRSPAGADRSAAAPASVRELVRRNTRRYAKRQLTWFRAEPNTLWVDPRDPGTVERIAGVVEAWRKHGDGSSREP